MEGTFGLVTYMNKLNSSENKVTGAEETMKGPKEILYLQRLLFHT